MAANASPLIAVSSMLQEALAVNQELQQVVIELVKTLNHDRKTKSPDNDGGKVRTEARAETTENSHRPDGPGDLGNQEERGPDMGGSASGMPTV